MKAARSFGTIATLLLSLLLLGGADGGCETQPAEPVGGQCENLNPDECLDNDECVTRFVQDCPSCTGFQVCEARP